MIALPAAPHMPGRNARPDPAIFAPLVAGTEGRDAAELAVSAAFLGGFDAFEAGYYWEAHELWEPVWAALPPASAERHLLRGLIQLANAGLKGRMGLSGASARILTLADAALAEGFGQTRESLMGTDRNHVARLRAAAAAESAL